MRYLLSLIIWHFPVFARFGLPLPEVCPTKSIHKSAFYNDDLKSGFDHIKNILNSSVSTFQLSTGCSSVGISNSGYVATDAHCLRDCLRLLGYVEQDENGVWVRTSKELPVKCPGDKHPITIVAMGKCWVQENPQKHESCNQSEDYAIFHVDVQLPSCIKVRTTPPVNDEPVLVYGFPMETKNREENRNSDGKSKYFSIGKVLGGAGSTCTAIQWKNGKRTETIVAGIPGQIPGLQRMTADVMRGNSGGPVIDGDGELIGLTNSSADVYDLTEDPTQPIECEGSAYFNPIQTILEKVQKQVSPEQFKEITDCRSKE